MHWFGDATNDHSMIHSRTELSHEYGMLDMYDIVLVMVMPPHRASYHTSTGPTGVPATGTDTQSSLIKFAVVVSKDL